MRNQIYVCPRGRGYWKERVQYGWTYKALSGRYVSFDKVVWC